ncbi:hypothetical protein BU15DRAFT_65498 [Melanogaster broomeanus]|nr:hypothetical protein BU15DRAFT_65498 [Melanogaster broomeanus]
MILTMYLIPFSLFAFPSKYKVAASGDGESVSLIVVKCRAYSNLSSYPVLSFCLKGAHGFREDVWSMSRRSRSWVISRHRVLLHILVSQVIVVLIHRWNAKDPLKILDGLGTIIVGCGMVSSVPRKDELGTPTQVWALSVILFSTVTPKPPLKSAVSSHAPYHLRLTSDSFGYNTSPMFGGIKYLGLVLCLMGGSASSGALTWVTNNVGGKYQLAAAIALPLAVAEVAAVVAVNLPESRRAPVYIRTLESICIGVGMATVLITAFTYKRTNAARDHEEGSQATKGGEGELKEGGAKPIGDRALSSSFMETRVLLNGSHAETRSARPLVRVIPGVAWSCFVFHRKLVSLFDPIGAQNPIGIAIQVTKLVYP